MESAVTLPSSVPPTVGEEIDGPGRQYFDDVVIDNMMDALLELSAEVWTCRDRLSILEQVLAEQGINATELIEAHHPSDEQRAALAAQRTAFVNRVFAGFARRGAPQQTGDNRQEPEQ